MQLATYLGVDPRTILNIENYKGNPKLSLLFSLLRVLKIDAWLVFNPEMKPSSPALVDLHCLINDCNEEAYCPGCTGSGSQQARNTH